MYLICTPDELLKAILTEAKSIENSIVADRRNGPSKRQSEGSLAKLQAKANGMRQAAMLVQIYIDSLAALAADDGALAKHFAKIDTNTDKA